MPIEITGVTKRFVRRGAAVEALAETSLSIATGEFVALVGPSGCGKSTLLNMIAGIVPPTSGRVIQDGAIVAGVNTRVGYMTQVDSLLPWRTAEANVALPLELRRWPRAQRKQRVRQYLDLVGLADFARHYPVELSGGMRKRIALAQVLVYDPDTLLMDEPFAALDAQLKLVMQGELLRVWEKSGKTVVFVTHDLAEAIALADRVIVFSGRPGRIDLVATVDIPRPRDVFRIRFVPRFGELYETIWSQLAPEIRKGEAL